MENINIIIDTVQQKLIRKIFSHLMGDILINSNIPMNRGISSSAAVCVALLKVINNHYT